MDNTSKISLSLILTIAMFSFIGCKKIDDPNNGGGNGSNGENPDTPAIVSTAEVQHNGTVFIEAIFEDESKLYFKILSPNEVALVNGELYYQDNPSSAYIYRGEVVIPNSISHLGSTYSVVSIADKAFYQNNLITSVYIPNSVLSILSSTSPYNSNYEFYYGAFQGCTHLESIHMSDNLEIVGANAFIGCPCFNESVTITNSVKSIGMNAFDAKTIFFNADNCAVAGGSEKNGLDGHIYYSAFPNMNSIAWGENVKVLPAFLYTSQNPTVIDIPSSVTIAPDNAFVGCSNLESINNFEKIMIIGRNAFSGCELLSSINLNPQLLSIEYGTFYGCKGLESIDIPNTVITINENAFTFCGLRSVVFGNSIDTIRSGAFRSCRNLYEVNIPNSVKYIGNDSFEDCEGLVSLTIGNNVTSINYRTFYGCKNLASVSFGNSIKVIDQYAFYKCPQLNIINLPSSIKSIKNNAFDESYSELTITCLAIEPPVLGERAFGGVGRIQAIYVPTASVEAYKTDDCWSVWADKIIGI